MTGWRLSAEKAAVARSLKLLGVPLPTLKRHTLAQKWDGHWIGCKTKKDIEVILAGWNAGDKAIPPIGSKTDRLSPSEGDIAWLEEKPRFLAEMWDEIVNTCKDALKSEPIGSVQERGL